MNFIIFVIIHAVLVFISNAVKLANVNVLELNALQAIYNATDGENWRWKSPTSGAEWNFTVTDPNPCHPVWQGITCSCGVSLCNITAIELVHYEMKGQLPDDVGNLPFLLILDFGHNKLSGSIPINVYTLVDLTYLDLSFNYQIGGTIPSNIGNLRNLTSLDLSYNSLEGTLPEELYTLTKLQVLFLAENSLAGNLSDSIGNLSQLTDVDLSYNTIGGTIPTTIGALGKLRNLSMERTHLTGTLPESMCNLTELQSLILITNQLRGYIPSCIGQWSQIVYLYLSENQLSCPVPYSITLTNQTLRRLYLYDNELTGPLPALLFTNASLEAIDMSSNNLDGPLPVFHLRRLQHLHITDNHFTGSISDSIVESTNLNYFKVGNNHIHGTIPSTIGYLHLLNTIDVSFNDMTGPLPDSSNSIAVVQFTVNNNGFSGTIPKQLTDYNFQYFEVGINMLSGTLSSLLPSKDLSIISAENNLFTGTLPTTWNESVVLNTFEVNNNILSGMMPDFSENHHLNYLYLQDNRLTGPVVLNNNTLLECVDLTSNQLTGSLPGDFFTNAKVLRSFAAADNCITGQLPVELCSVPVIEFIDLDGLSTATSCRHRLFPSSHVFESYVLTNSISGEIPDCWFGMELLNTLHLSGNSIQWSFPDDLQIAQNLTILDLSHNRLTGTIPSYIQNRQWSSLDLSFNRLSGTLSMIEQTTEGATLTLQVNRLSGTVPSALLNMEGINILTGNIFGCNFQNNNLPTHDRGYSTYQCGSNAFDESAIVWLVTSAVLIIAAGAVYVLNRYMHSKFQTYVGPYVKVVNTYVAAFNDDLHSFRSTVWNIQKVAVILTVTLLVILLPLYGILSTLYRTVVHQYAWSVSSAYLGGLTPAMILFACYMVLIFSLYFFFYKMLPHPVDGTSDKSDMTTTSLLYVQLGSLIVLVLINCGIMVVVNGAYVYIILTQKSSVIFVSQICIAIFKLLWNDVLGWAVRIIRQKSGVALETEMPYVTFIYLFNIIVAPCFATAAVDSNCFYNAFIAPATVSSTFDTNDPTLDCSYDSTFNKETCKFDSHGGSTVVSYNPPFIYNYQCSSSILTNYASVYVFMFLIVAFVKPVGLVLLTRIHSLLKHGSFMQRCITKALPTLLLPPTTEQLLFTKTLFRKDKFVLSTISKFAVLLTFGVMFPPLAVVVCVAFVTEGCVHLLMIGRFLANIEDAEAVKQYREKLRKDCEGCLDLLLVPLARLVIPLAACFYGFIVFDIYGDAVGARAAIWCFFVLSFAPVLIWMLYTGSMAWQYRRTENQALDSKPSEVGMITVNELRSNTADCHSDVAESTIDV